MPLGKFVFRIRVFSPLLIRNNSQGLTHNIALPFGERSLTPRATRFPARR